MNVQMSLALLLAASVISFQDEEGGDNITARKHYGLSFHSKCIDYVKSFSCMTTCKSIGFQIFRMDFRCKCSCHGLKTTTILPFFKWRTNGTTKTLPSTQSPKLYHIAGTLSPAPTESEQPAIEETSTPRSSVPPETTTSTESNITTTTGDVSGNATSVDDASATIDAGEVTTDADGSATKAVDGTTTTAEGGQSAAEGITTVEGAPETTPEGGTTSESENIAESTTAQSEPVTQ